MFDGKFEKHALERVFSRYDELCRIDGSDESLAETVAGVFARAPASPNTVPKPRSRDAVSFYVVLELEDLGCELGSLEPLMLDSGWSHVQKII